MRFLWVFSVVLVNVADGLILRFATQFKLSVAFDGMYGLFQQAINILTTKESLIALFLIGCSYTLNVSKFVIWGLIHKRYDLSGSYPIMALLYPIMYIIAIINGEAVLDLYKCIGTIFIMVGTVLANQVSET